MTSSLDDWERGSFTAAGTTRATYRRGSGPGVIVIHEVPGITPKVTEFANDVVEAGFTVLMPSLVGDPGREPTGLYVWKSMFRVCIAKEFTNWATNRTSPISAYLREMARTLHEECGGPGIGVIGMCFSGGFALGMMVDGHVATPVLSQPSLPFAVGKKRGADLNLSAADLDEVKQRATNGCEVLGLRFRDDKFVGTRFETLRRELGDSFVAVELPSAKKADHSVVTEQRDEPTVQRVLDFFRDKLVVQ